MNLPDNHSLDDPTSYSQSMPEFEISQQDVIDSIKVLKTGKATGPDLVNSYVLKEIVLEISRPLQDLFNFSLRSGKVPRSWKLANVCAIYKKSDPHDVSNYRPISLLSVISKVLERILHKYIFNFYNLQINRLSYFLSVWLCSKGLYSQSTCFYISFILFRFG